MIGWEEGGGVVGRGVVMRELSKVFICSLRCWSRIACIISSSRFYCYAANLAISEPWRVTACSFCTGIGISKYTYRVTSRLYYQNALTSWSDSHELHHVQFWGT